MAVECIFYQFIMLTKIKVCGLTREADAKAAITLGVDALGFVFYPRSKRAITPQQLSWIKRLPPFVQLTALFVNPSASTVHAVLENISIDLLQFHGNESSEFCEQFKRRYIKAVPMEGLDASNAKQYMLQHPNACGFILDNYGIKEIGGSGTAFDWKHIPDSPPAPLTMAGGLNAENVQTVIEAITPYGVDVSSGVESAFGIKSTEKMAAFITAVRHADRVR